MYARLFLLNGGQLAILSKLMGHSTIQITVEYYAIFTAAEHQEAHDKYSPVNGLKGVINFGGGSND
jgi:integrase/recombinase XerD